MEPMELHPDEHEAFGAWAQDDLAEALRESLPVGLALFRGRDLCLRWCNPTYRSYFSEPGGNQVPLVGLRLDEYAPREIGEGVLHHLRSVAERGRPEVSGPLEFRGAGWGLTWWRYLLVPVAVEGERHVLAIVLEITEELRARRKAEELAVSLAERLAERKRLHEDAMRRAAVLDATLGAVVEGLILYDAEGRIVRMNDAARALTGYTEDDERRPVEERVARLKLLDADGNPAPLSSYLPLCALAGEVVRGVIQGFERPGGRVWASVSAAPIVDEAGRRLGAVLTVTDVTAQRELQEGMADLLRMVSHDLRTPLTAIQIRAQRLARTLPAEGKDRDTAEAINLGCKRMDGMIKELVEWGRLGVGLLEIEPRPVELGPLVAGLLGRNAPAVDASRVEVAIPEGLPPLHADPDRLERILLNLLGNALKYSPPGAPVRLEAGAEDGTVVIRVIDRGAGVPPEDRERIFDRFYRAKSGGTAEGLGLGLFITRRLVELHGGRIAVTASEVGRGSTFEARLPAALPH